MANSITMTWTHATGARTGYKVRLYKGEGCTGSNEMVNLSTDTTQGTRITVTGRNRTLRIGHRYSAEVRTYYSTNDDVDRYSTPTACVVMATKPGQLTNLSMQSSTLNSVTMQWTTVAGADWYEIEWYGSHNDCERRNARIGSDGEDRDIEGTSWTSDNNFNKNTTYHFHARGHINTQGSDHVPGLWSTCVAARTRNDCLAMDDQPWTVGDYTCEGDLPYAIEAQEGSVLTRYLNDGEGPDEGERLTEGGAAFVCNTRGWDEQEHTSTCNSTDTTQGTRITVTGRDRTLRIGHRYSAEVRAYYSTNDDVDRYSTPTRCVVMATQPGQLTNLRMQSSTLNSVTMQWTAVAGADWYEIEWYGSHNDCERRNARIGSDGEDRDIEGTSWTSGNNLNKNTTYHFHARGHINTQGSDHVPGLWSTCVEARTRNDCPATDDQPWTVDRRTCKDDLPYTIEAQEGSVLARYLNDGEGPDEGERLTKGSATFVCNTRGWDEQLNSTCNPNPSTCLRRTGGNYRCARSSPGNTWRDVTSNALWCDDRDHNCYEEIPAPQIQFCGGGSVSSCEGAGGTPYDTGSCHICKFNRSTCPSGWGWYEDNNQVYTSTSARTCSATCGEHQRDVFRPTQSCTTRSHSFGAVSLSFRETSPGTGYSSGLEYCYPCGFDVVQGSCYANVTAIGCTRGASRPAPIPMEPAAPMPDPTPDPSPTPNPRPGPSPSPSPSPRPPPPGDLPCVPNPPAVTCEHNR